ncbi:hypothetical protein [Alkaliphilus crotonatoxidans]
MDRVLALTAVAVVSMLPAIVAGAMVVGTMAAAATGVVRISNSYSSCRKGGGHRISGSDGSNGRVRYCRRSARNSPWL